MGPSSSLWGWPGKYSCGQLGLSQIKAVAAATEGKLFVTWMWRARRAGLHPCGLERQRLGQGRAGRLSIKDRKAIFPGSWTRETLKRCWQNKLHAFCFVYGFFFFCHSVYFCCCLFWFSFCFVLCAFFFLRERERESTLTNMKLYVWEGGEDLGRIGKGGKAWSK